MRQAVGDKWRWNVELEAGEIDRHVPWNPIATAKKLGVTRPLDPGKEVGGKLQRAKTAPTKVFAKMLPYSCNWNWLLVFLMALDPSSKSAQIEVQRVTSLEHFLFGSSWK